MVELRKRKADTEVVPPPLKKANSVKSASGSNKAASAPSDVAEGHKVVSGDTVNLDDFGGEIETNDGVKVTLKKLLEESKNGVVLFTYPKASTPGCTTQACLFRDEYESLTVTGFSIYGLSTDSPKSNSNFKSKQKLPYTLLCDPSATLIKAIGMKKSPSGTIRGVFVINKEAKIQAAAPGGSTATVEVVRNLVGAASDTGKDLSHLTRDEKVGNEAEVLEAKAQDGEQHTGNNGNDAKAEIAAEVADSAEKLDGETHEHAGSNGNDDKAEVAAEVADTAEKLDSEAQA